MITPDDPLAGRLALRPPEAGAEASDTAGGRPEPPALLLTREELARELRTSPKTITRMDQAGRLPRALKIGRGKRWPRKSIIAWISAGCPRRAEWEAFSERTARQTR